MTRVTLIFATTVFLPELPGGFRRLFHYAPGLAERGVEMKVVTFCGEHNREGRVTENTIEIISLKELEGDEIAKRVFLNCKALEEARENLDIGKQIVFPIGINAAIAKSLREAKRLGIRTMMFVTNAPELPESWFWALRQRIGASLWMSVFSKLIFCSEGQKELHCKTCWIPKSKAVAIPNGVNTSRFHPVEKHEKLRLRRELGLGQDDFLFVYTGNIIPRKNIDFLLRAWKPVSNRYPKAKLLLVGNRSVPKTFRFEGDLKEFEEFELRMESALENLGPQSDSVHFVGHTDCVEDWLKASDVFVFPSLREGLPNSLIEAMACGLPCLTTPFASFPNDGEELGRMNREFLLLPFKEEEWTLKMTKMLESPDERDRVGTAGSDWVAKIHGYEAILDRFAELYHTC